MSALETIRATSLANSAGIAKHCATTLLEGNSGSAEEQAAAALIVETLVATVHRLWAVPLEVTVAWPSGVQKHARATLRAQLQRELDQAAVRRAQEEFREVVSVAPQLANAFSAWAIALSK